MTAIKSFFKRNWWPITAMLFCPCHLPLSMGAISLVTAGTALGALFAANYAAIETVLAVTFSIYFVFAFLIWIARAPRPGDAAACSVPARNGKPLGFTMPQTVSWGMGSALLMPTLVLAAFVSRQGLWDEIRAGARNFDVSQSGFIWLVSISAIVMIPVMVVWIAWMWSTWMRADNTNRTEKWERQYDYDAD